MLLPKSLYGSASDARRGARGILKQIAACDDLSRVDLIDTESHPGDLIVTQSFAQPSGLHFHLYAIMRLAVAPPRTNERLHGVFDALVAQFAWGPLCLLSHDMNLVDVGAERERNLVSALLRHWDVYVAEGGRYSGGGSAGSLWGHAIFLQAIFQKRGIGPQDRLRHSDLGAFLESHRAELDDLSVRR